jgi:hypothetical protein
LISAFKILVNMISLLKFKKWLMNQEDQK